MKDRTMNSYMVTIGLPDVLDEEFISLIPRQRAHVDTLMSSGVITTYAVAKDRTRLWTTIIAESEYDVKAVVEAFPLRKFMNVEVVELLFHRSPSMILTHVSLN